MAAPSSGLIRLSGIFSEINEDDYSSLNNDGEVLRLSQMFDGTWGSINTNSSNYPTNTNPDRMSEFHGYDHDASAALQSYSSSPVQSKNPCGYNNSGLTNTFYHDGSNVLPAQNDTAYANSQGTTTLEPGNYKINTLESYYAMSVGNSGVISSVVECT